MSTQKEGLRRRLIPMARWITAPSYETKAETFSVKCLTRKMPATSSWEVKMAEKSFHPLPRRVLKESNGMRDEVGSLTQPPVTPQVVASHGLIPEEYRKIVKLLGRDPNHTELGVFSVMWSEHCSYKSSRHYLRRLPTEGPHALQGPGENAGVVDIGDGLAVAFKMESHNHPSFIEPYQGAATGVGGILRDVFTMGARPIASLNSLRFGSIDHPRTRYLLSGVVAGIGGYGNCIGVP